MKKILLILIFLLHVLPSPVFSFSETPGEDLPYFDEVTRIMAPLQYSGLDNLLGENSKLSLDFQKKTWTLHNVYDFDEQGNILLAGGNNGLCGSLSRYLYNAIKPLFNPKRFEIVFAKVKERDYFFMPQATHIVLMIFDKENQRKYLLDPSFKRYGVLEDFEQYVFFDHDKPEVFMRSNRNPDKFFNVNSASPILIRDDHLILFSVEESDGKFDNKNFILSVSAIKRRASNSDYILGLRYSNGRLQTYGNADMAQRFLKPEEIIRLQYRLLHWTETISADVPL